MPDNMTWKTRTIDASTLAHWILAYRIVAFHPKQNQQVAMQGWIDAVAGGFGFTDEERAAFLDVALATRDSVSEERWDAIHGFNH